METNEHCSALLLNTGKLNSSGPPQAIFYVCNNYVYNNPPQCYDKTPGRFFAEIFRKISPPKISRRRLGKHSVKIMTKIRSRPPEADFFLGNNKFPEQKTSVFYKEGGFIS